MNQCLTISSFLNSNKASLSKTISVNSKGELVKASSAELSRGRVNQRSFESLEDFCKYMCSLPPHMAVALGLSGYKTAFILSKDKLASYQGKKTVITRSRENFFWSKGPGILVLDYDPAPNQKPLTPDVLVQIIREAVPELKHVTIGVKPSASSYIYQDDKELSSLNGQHAFIACTDARRIPEIGQLIYQRLWLAGHGYFRISGSGSMLERSIVDTTVWQPERLIFGRANCADGLEQRFPEPLIFRAENEDLIGQERWLDADDLTPLSDQDKESFSAVVAEAKQALKPQADTKKDKWVDSRAQEALGQDASHEELEAKKAEIRSAIDNGCILPKDLVLHKQGGGTVKVSELIQSPHDWHQTRFADPFEPDYSNGDDRIATAILMKCDEPYIHSHAHGGIKYYFKSEHERHQETISMFDIITDPVSEPRFKITHAADFAKGKLPSWRIKHILPETGLAMVYGASGAGKSFFVQDMLASIAQGKNWQGHRTKKGKVIYIAAEGAGGVRARLCAYAQHNDIDLTDIDLYILDDTPNIHGADTDILIRDIEAAGSADVIVFDTLAQVSAGANENSGEDMGPILKRCQKIYQHFKALVILVHHSGKDSSRGSRGWSGLKAPLDTEIEVRGEDDGKKVATLTKQKDGEQGQKFAFRLVPIIIGLDEDEEPINSCVTEFQDYTSDQGPVLRGAWQKAIYAAAKKLSGLDCSALSEGDVVFESIRNMPIKAGERDRSKENAKRALNTLVSKNVLARTNEGLISLPQNHNSEDVAVGRN